MWGRFAESLSRPLQAGPWYRYGFLAVLFGLIALNLFSLFRYYPYGLQGSLSNLFGVSLLLVNHVAFQFDWPRPWALRLRLFALAWVAVALLNLVWQTTGYF